MADRGRIMFGLGAFLVVAAYPLWSAVAAEGNGDRPALERAVDRVDSTDCIEDTVFMKAHHHELLNDWRQAVIRDEEREYASTSGRTWEMSLTGTCLGCHASSEAFCTRCHDYADAKPTCFDCHVVPEGGVHTDEEHPGAVSPMAGGGVP